MNLKKITYWICILLFISCGNEYDLDEYFDLEDLPGYVAFDAPGQSTNLSAIIVSEDGGAVSLTIENPTGTLSDITVEYSFGGDAVFGVDYEVENASASGGTIVIEHHPTDFQNPDRVNLNVQLMTDGVVDGEKQIMITLESAANEEGNLAVGRGGTDLLKSATIIINDID